MRFSAPTLLDGPEPGDDVSPAPAEQWLNGCRWEDAMVPYAVWKGLWSVKRGTYRNQPLGGR
ncbi:hypothetical protein [Streptomyces sp. NPDC005125]